jgi:hypothetical protein
MSISWKPGSPRSPHGAVTTHEPRRPAVQLARLRKRFPDARSAAPGAALRPPPDAAMRTGLAHADGNARPARAPAPIPRIRRLKASGYCVTRSRRPSRPPSLHAVRAGTPPRCRRPVNRLRRGEGESRRGGVEERGSRGEGESRRGGVEETGESRRRGDEGGRCGCWSQSSRRRISGKACDSRVRPASLSRPAIAPSARSLSNPVEGNDCPATSVPGHVKMRVIRPGSLPVDRHHDHGRKGSHGKAGHRTSHTIHHVGELEERRQC